jgi:hypothetical protein
MYCYKHNKYYANLQQLKKKGNGIFVLLKPGSPNLVIKLSRRFIEKIGLHFSI